MNNLFNYSLIECGGGGLSDFLRLVVRKTDLLKI